MLKPFVTALHDHIVDLSDLKTKTWWEKYLRGVTPFYGVNLTAIRTALHEKAKEFCISEWDPITLLDLADDLFVDPHAEPKLAAMSTLVVQAFPPNCRAWVRRPGGSWSALGETPTRRSVAVGTYEVKVEFKPTGETRIERVEVTAGTTPPVRFAFGAPQ